ncbi:hypothetical protein AWB79_00156 [Caballeronia hypogeia]|uniref:Uncharacterized protein n=1 Tax=Caballeronia hypogeia TaxID=1777140 RepID=A0A157Z2M9_9BURK|nr:hypothetical protein [Caballeronia hypogeia]SAK39786.1 hypothetical protein AWB79_00156 [Caballeronia hypogeia]
MSTFNLVSTARIKTVKRLRRASCVGVLLLAATASFNASASKIEFPYQDRSLKPISFPANIVVPKDVVIGTLLAETNYEPDISTDGGICDITKIVSVNGTPAPSVRNAYQTNLPGVGIRFLVTDGWNGDEKPAPSVSSFPLNSTPQAYEHHIIAQLVVTGPFSPGQLKTLPSLNVIFNGTCISSVVVTQFIAPGTVIR